LKTANDDADWFGEASRHRQSRTASFPAAGCFSPTVDARVRYSLVRDVHRDDEGLTGSASLRWVTGYFPGLAQDGSLHAGEGGFGRNVMALTQRHGYLFGGRGSMLEARSLADGHRGSMLKET
jgi:hypothetical protein